MKNVSKMTDSSLVDKSVMSGGQCIPGDIIIYPLLDIFPEIFIVERIVIIMKTLGAK